MAKQKEPNIEEGSGNVFADLGFADAGELFARAQIGFHVFKILEDENLTQREIARILAIPQPEVSHPHERALQPLHDRQNARLPQASWPCRVDPHQPPPQRRTLSEGAFRSGPPLRPQTHPSRCPREAQKAPPCMIGGKVHDPSSQA